jgi:ATP-dependent exoDNAse (exonuclease V) beta subunit
VAPESPKQISKLDDHDQRILEQIRSAVATWLKLVDRVPAADLLDRILQESAYVYEVPQTRRTQALENIKKMRSMVRRIQNRGYATLARIADHLDTLSLDDEPNAFVEPLNSVQLMTIHAAKGLEFPIVFLVNLARGTGGGHGTRVRVVPAHGDRDPSVSVGEYKTPEDEDETASNKEETKRLLYVATTRARDYLYFSSTLDEGVVKGRPGSIAQVLPETFLSVCERAAQAPETEDTVQWTVKGKGTHSFRVCRASDRDSDSDRTVASRDTVIPRNDFATLSPRVRLPHVAASRVGSVESPNRVLPEESSTAGKSSRLLGTLVHRLLAVQQRPEVTQPEEIGRRLREIAQTTESVALDENDHALSDAVTLYQSIAGQDEVVQLLQQPCIHEVPFSFFLPGETPRVMRGMVDCLVREDETCVAVVEFKTGKPRDEDRVQLEAYLQAARMFFPDLQVRGRLIYAGKSASEK